MAKYVVEHPTLGGEYEFPEDMTFGEGLTFERLTGVALEDSAKGGLRVSMGYLFTAMKRVHKDLNFEDLEDISMGGVEEVVDEPEGEPDAEADPTPLPDVDAELLV